MNKKPTGAVKHVDSCDKPTHTPTVKLANGMEVPDTQEARFVLAWERKTAGKVWDSSVGKYGAWVAKAEGR